MPDTWTCTWIPVPESWWPRPETWKCF